MTTLRYFIADLSLQFLFISATVVIEYTTYWVAIESEVITDYRESCKYLDDTVLLVWMRFEFASILSIMSDLQRLLACIDLLQSY